MSPTAVGVTGLVIMFALFFFRVPIGIAMLLVGSIGFAILVNWPAASSLLSWSHACGPSRGYAWSVEHRRRPMR